MRAALSERVVDIFAGAPVAHEPRLAELSEMAGDARLSHGQDLLNLDDGKLLLLEQKEQAQTCFVGEEAQGFYD